MRTWHGSLTASSPFPREDERGRALPAHWPVVLDIRPAYHTADGVTFFPAWLVATAWQDSDGQTGMPWLVGHRRTQALTCAKRRAPFPGPVGPPGRARAAGWQRHGGFAGHFTGRTHASGVSPAAPARRACAQRTARKNPLKNLGARTQIILTDKFLTSKPC